MKTKLLVPGNVTSSNGVGPVVEVDADGDALLVLTLAIERVVEQESLRVNIWGSTDNQDWGPLPLTSFPPKSYCGVYSQILNMARHADIRYLRTEWKVSRWSKIATTPLFEFRLTASEQEPRLRKPADSVSSANLGLPSMAVA